MQTIGHAAVLARIQNEGLPPVSLFIGPASVGKRRLAEMIARREVHDEQDVLRVNRLTTELAHHTANFLIHAPSGAGKRFVILRIDGASESALNVLLKSLEELSPYCHVILLAITLPAPTVVSRATLFPFTLLTEAEVEATLLLRGFSPGEASIRAEEVGGQIQPALEHADLAQRSMLVLAAVRCIREHDPSALEGLAGRWTDDHTTLLVKLAHEAVTKRWRVFSEDEVGDVPASTWLAVLRALKPKVSPRLVVHSQLMSVVMK